MINVFQPNIRTEEVLDSLRDVFNSGWIGMGPRVEELESRVCDVVGSNHFVATNSCTAAIHLALKVCDLQAGSKILTSPVTCPAPNVVILNEGHTPVFYDIDPHTGNINTSYLKRLLYEHDHIAAIVLVHFGGYPCDMSEIQEICDESGIRIIEDCAHSLGSTYNDKPIGSSGNLCCFSFDYLKNMTTIDGGGIATNDKDCAVRMKELSWWGGTKHTYKRIKKDSIEFDYDINEPGLKYHMNDVNAAIGLVQLGYLEEDNNRRRKIANEYTRRLSNHIHIPVYRDDRASSFHILPTHSHHRDALIEHLNRRGIKPGHHYPRNDQYSAFKVWENKLPGVNAFCRTQLTLPIHPSLTNDDVDKIIQAVNSFKT